MHTSTVYHDFAMQHEALTREVTKRITEATCTEQIWLLGLTAVHSRTETLFAAPSAGRRGVSHCWLLVTVPAPEGPSLNGLQDKIESRLQSILPATAVVLTVTQFYRWLLEGHPFAVAVQEKGFLLHQKEEAGKVLPKAVDGEGLAAAHARLFAQTKTRVREFLAGAELYTVRLQYRLAAFLLHQAAEQALRTMLILHTGLRLNSHSIDRLVRCCTLFCPGLPDLLSGTAEKDGRLFRLLQTAYVNTRYGDDYHIKGEDVKRLTQKVKDLYALLLKGQRPYDLQETA